MRREGRPYPLPSAHHPLLFTCSLPHPSYRTAGTLFGEGFRAFVTDWDKVTATVSHSIWTVI